MSLIHNKRCHRGGWSRFSGGMSFCSGWKMSNSISHSLNVSRRWTAPRHGREFISVRPIPMKRTEEEEEAEEEMSLHHISQSQEPPEVLDWLTREKTHGRNSENAAWRLENHIRLNVLWRYGQNVWFYTVNMKITNPAKYEDKCHCDCGGTFLSRLHTSHKVVALVPAVVLIRVIERHSHSFVLVPLVPHVCSLDGVLDALFFGSQTTGATPACVQNRTTVCCLLIDWLMKSERAGGHDGRGCFQEALAFMPHCHKTPTRYPASQDTPRSEPWSHVANIETFLAKPL